MEVVIVVLSVIFQRELTRLRYPRPLGKVSATLHTPLAFDFS